MSRQALSISSLAAPFFIAPTQGSNILLSSSAAPDDSSDFTASLPFIRIHT